MTQKKQIIISDWDSSLYLKTQKDISEYLDAVFEIGDAKLIKSAIEKIARSRGMTAVARDAGISRQGLYNALSESGNPGMQVMNNILKSFGFRLAVTPIANDNHSASVVAA